MSQNPPMEVPLKEEDRKLLKSAIELLSKSPQQTSESSLSPSSQKKDEAEGHKTIQEIDDCLDCHKLYKVDEYNEKKLKEWMEKNIQDADYKCEKCELPVKKEESGKTDWKCPNCGHAFAKPK